MKVVISRNIRIEEPSVEIRQWATQNLVLDNPEYAKKAQMGFYTGNIPKKLTLYEVHGKTWIFPFGALYWLRPYLHDCQMWSDFPKHNDIRFGGEEVPLYDYQQTAVDAMYAARYGILESPAGSGKTQMGIALIKKWQRPALWLCHTADLLNQSRERAERYINRDLIGTITEGKVNIGAGVTFATVQTMCNLDLEEYRNLWDVIITDECHHLAGSPTQMTRYYKVLNNLAARHKYGLTATPDRSDGMIRATYNLIGSVMWKVPETAVADKIMKVGIRPVYTDVGPCEEMYNSDGTLSYAGLIGSLCGNMTRNRQITEDLVQEQEHSCLILSDRLDHLRTLMDMLPEGMREQAVMIDGSMTSKAAKKARECALEMMRTGDKKYLFATYALAKEGLDVPRMDRLFLTTPVKYHATVVQSIGRIARTHDGKGSPIAYDYIDNGIRYCTRAWKERQKHYRSVGATIL